VDVVLVGLPGSGKTAVGKRLARRHQAEFVDLDDIVQRLAGRSIPAIFETDGEAGFRRIEREAVRSLGPADEAPGVRRVIATGGGAVIDPRNRWLLYRGRFPVWLDCPPEVLAGRLRRSHNVRPLVAGGDPLGSIARLAAERRRFYAPALQLSGGAPIDAIAGAVEARTADAARAGTTVLRADTPIGRIEIGHGIAPVAVSSALQRAEARRAILISEPGAWYAAGAGIAAALEAEGRSVETVMLPRCEDAKRMAVVEEACRELARLRVDRRETLVAIGGGALTDAAGFVAAVYLRGVAVIHVPTTLVGQIDAALGGKTAVDIPEGKNLVGAFHQPAAFIADTAFLATLPARQRRAALGEVVKMAALGDERLLEVVESEGEPFARGENTPLDSGAVVEMVERCAWAKAEIVMGDERESGRRMLLNLGHTLGHGIEAAAGYEAILHGEAVAYGLRGALAISRTMGLVSPGRAARIETALDRLGLAIEPPAVTAEAVMEHAASDKKHAMGRLSWILPTDMGAQVRSDVPAEAVAAGMAAALRRPATMRVGSTQEAPR
jgi:shikimate kinase / 3-dehydroquinate synthase